MKRNGDEVVSIYTSPALISHSQYAAIYLETCIRLWNGHDGVAVGNPNQS